MNPQLRIHALTLALFGSLTLSMVAMAQDDGEAAKDFTEPGESGAVLPKMVVEAENETRQDIEKDNFEFELTAALIDSFYTVTDAEALGISPVSGLKPHLNNLERLASDQPPHYWLREMSGQPVANFYPGDMEGHGAKSWRLDITDYRGNTFKSFSGSKKAPKRISWDGRGDNGDILQAGYPYSYVFSLTDEGTNTYNHAGASFRIEALDHREDGDRVLALSGDEIFDEESSELTESGKRWLTKSTDLVRQHPYSPVRIRVIAEKMALAEGRAESVAHYLADSMILPREQIETEAEQRPDLRAELDGLVRIVIEHAD
jgi:hypothetical protein